MKPFDVDVDKFSRQTWEEDDAWHAYQAYRDLFAQRSIEDLLQVLGKDKRYQKKIELWMVENRWQERNLEADRSRDLELRRREVDEISEMRIRHIRMGLDLQDLGHAQLKRYVKMLEVMAETGEMGNKNAAREFKPKNIVEFIEAGTKLERLNMDMADSITEHRVEVSDEEDEERSRLMLHNAKVRKAMKAIAKEMK